MELLATAADWFSPAGSFLRSFACTTNAPGPTTESTRSSAAICFWKLPMRRSSAGVVIGCLSDTTSTLYGVGQPGPMARATCSKFWRACEDAGSWRTSGGPVWMFSSGTQSTTSTAVASAPIATGRRTIASPTATRRAQPRANGPQRCRCQTSSRCPARTRTAGSTATAAPTLSSVHRSTPMPSEERITVGAIATARSSESVMAVPP